MMDFINFSSPWPWLIIYLTGVFFAVILYHYFVKPDEQDIGGFIFPIAFWPIILPFSCLAFFAWCFVEFLNKSFHNHK